MNATVQCLKSVPELRDALQSYKGGIMQEINITCLYINIFFLDVTDGASVVPAQSITAALRDLYSTMDKGNNVPPIVLLQMLHMAFPRFAEKNEHGGFAQQVLLTLFYLRNSCWLDFGRISASL